MTNICPPEALAEVLALANQDSEQGLNRIDRLIADYGADARLRFLQGSLLASLKRYDEAHGAMKQAIDLEPGYDLARFQLGLLELSSGRPDLATETLTPLSDRSPEEPLRVLGEGLRLLITDDLAGAIVKLRLGVALNPDNEAINRDMHLLIADIERAIGGEAPVAASKAEGQEEEVTSSAQLLLQQFGRKPTQH